MQASLRLKVFVESVDLRPYGSLLLGCVVNNLFRAVNLRKQ